MRQVLFLLRCNIKDNSTEARKLRGSDYTIISVPCELVKTTQVFLNDNFLILDRALVFADKVNDLLALTGFGLDGQITISKVLFGIHAV